MTDWLNEIDVELRRAEQSRHPGRIRTVARRIAGTAIRQLPDTRHNLLAGEDTMTALRGFIRSPELPEEIRAAASRLEARLSPDFTSPSIDPIADAMIIVGFVKEMLRADGCVPRGENPGE
jgi:hypothetical protein